MPGMWRAIRTGGRFRPLLVALVLATSLSAQVDSLERVLVGLPQDSSRLPVLRALFHAEVFRTPARASVYAEAFAALAATVGTARQRAQAQAMLGQALYVGGYGLRALPHFQRAPGRLPCRRPRWRGRSGAGQHGRHPGRCWHRARRGPQRRTRHCRSGAGWRTGMGRRGRGAGPGLPGVGTA
ncbi:MAG: hypothetical protein IPM68_08860 [Flavobacteriales bacterium]|nr:hypothetical protein [Flavobacteriales bacterium]